MILCFEEAIGYMCSTEVLDKDGVSACAQMCSCASYIYNQSKTMNKLLDEIFDKYGLHITNNSYYVCKDAGVIKKIFERIRNIRGPNTVVEKLVTIYYVYYQLPLDSEPSRTIQASSRVSRSFSLLLLSQADD